MQHLTPLIVERVNRFFGYAAVDKIAFRQGRVDSAKRPVRPAPRAVPRELGEGLREIADPGPARLPRIARRQACHDRTERPSCRPNPNPFHRYGEFLDLFDPPRARRRRSRRARRVQCRQGHDQRHRRRPAPQPPGRRRPPMATGRPSSAQTPEGGFVMGNPNAKVKLIEFGSMTCPHCAEFEEKGAQAADRQLRQEGAGLRSNSATSSAIPMTSPPR